MNSSPSAAEEPLLIISGLPSPEPLPSWVQAWSDAGVAQWVAPQSLLGPRGMAMAGRQAHIVWLYRAPWAGVGSGRLKLGSWLSLQRQALRQRGQNADAWTLVNADQVDADALADSLGLWMDTPAAPAAGTDSEESSTPGQDLLWAKIFDWAAPQAWDTFEALEAAAWSGPQHAPPLLRDELPTPDQGALEGLQHLLWEADAQRSRALEWQERAAQFEAALQAAQQDAAEQVERALMQASAFQAEAQAVEQMAREAAEESLSKLEQAFDELRARTAERDEARTLLQELLDEAQDRQNLLQQTQGMLQAAQEEWAAQLEASQAAQAEASQQLSETSGQLTETARQLAEAQAFAAQRESQLKEAQEEGELLLLQLHQVQEELEQLFLQGKEREATAAQAAAAAQAAQDQLSGQLAEAQASAAQRESQLKESQAALEQTRNELQTRTVERDQLKAERDQRTAERDKANAALQQAQAAQAETSRQLAQASGQLTETSRQLAEAQASAAQRESQLKEAQEEGELLLLQLHQVQEELETHFLKGKELEQQLQSVRTRYQRLQSKHPQAVDVDAVQVAACDASAEVPLVTWRLKGLSVGGTVWPDLVLHTSLESAGPGVKLEAPAGSAAARGMAGPIVPKALVARDAGQLERFRGVGQQAWQVLIAACAAVDEALGTTSAAIPGAPIDFDATFWRQSLGALAPVLHALPPVFRHDGVRLKREKVNPDYEHLWLVFEGAAFGAQPMPGFEMRLGAAQISPGGFSHLPKLEFPLGVDGKPPFEGWFEESRDDYGPKFELRADLNRQAFDVGVWSRTPKNSQSMLLSLIASLPAALDCLEAQRSRLSRPMSDWRLLTTRLIEVIRTRLASPKPTPLPTMPPQPTMAPKVTTGRAKSHPGAEQKDSHPTSAPTTAVSPAPRQKIASKVKDGASKSVRAKRS
jgi:hypothetical protein